MLGKRKTMEKVDNVPRFSVQSKATKVSQVAAIGDEAAGACVVEEEAVQRPSTAPGDGEGMVQSFIDSAGYCSEELAKVRTRFFLRSRSLSLSFSLSLSLSLSSRKSRSSSLLLHRSTATPFSSFRRS